MTRRVLQVIGIAVIVGVLVFMVLVLFDRGAEAPTEQNNNGSLSETEQSEGDQDENTTIKPNANNQEFHLTAANLSCSSSTMDGVSSHNCSGTIRVVPQAQSDMQPGVYKINEQTKLLHNSREQDLSSLQQLAQNNTVVRLKLADGSNDTLAEIRY